MAVFQGAFAAVLGQFDTVLQTLLAAVIQGAFAAVLGQFDTVLQALLAAVIQGAFATVFGKLYGFIGLQLTSADDGQQ